MRDLSATEVSDLLGSAEPPQLLDVREAWEVETAALPGAVHIPMGEVPARMDELERQRPVVVMCHHGRRSVNVAMLLERNGFADVINLAGGIAAWSETVDPSVPDY